MNVVIGVRFGSLQHSNVMQIFTMENFFSCAKECHLFKHSSFQANILQDAEEYLTKTSQFINFKRILTAK